MTLHSIRKSYDKNYLKMLHTIQKMGGDNQIKFHQKNKTPLYQTLQKLQKKEHYLNEMETRLVQPQEMY